MARRRPEMVLYLSFWFFFCPVKLDAKSSMAYFGKYVQYSNCEYGSNCKGTFVINNNGKDSGRVFNQHVNDLDLSFKLCRWAAGVKS